VRWISPFVICLSDILGQIELVSGIFFCWQYRRCVVRIAGTLNELNGYLGYMSLDNREGNHAG
jgi:hypothetical protein